MMGGRRLDALDQVTQRVGCLHDAEKRVRWRVASSLLGPVAWAFLAAAELYCPNEPDIVLDAVVL